jgi:hypothetical protein
MIRFFTCFLLSCTQDVSITKVNEVDILKTQDTSSVITVEPSSTPTSEPTAEPSTELSVNYDMVSGYFLYHFKQVACPACVGVYNEIEVTAYMKTHYPTSGNYFDNYQPVGTCTTAIYDSYVSSQPNGLSGQVVIKGNGNPITLSQLGASEWQANSILEYQYERQTFHTVTGPQFEIQNAFQTLEGFDYIEPYTMLWVDPSYAFDAPIRRTGMTFTWGPAIDGLFEVIVAVYSWDGSQFLGAVSCLENDTGALFVPAQYLQQYSPGSIAAIHLIRHRMDSVESPDLQGSVQTHMMWEVIGTGYIE